MSARLLRVSAALAVAGLALAPAPGAQAQTAPGTWTSAVEAGTRHLRYSARVTLLGKPAQVTVDFYCDPTRTREASGALGFDLQIGNVAGLAPFAFDDFEGPDATVPGQAMRVTVSRAGQPDRTFDAAPNGWRPDADGFTFGFAEVSHLAESEPKAILRALTAGADRFRVVITDPRNPALKLDVTVPVSGKQKEFEALLVGVK